MKMLSASCKIATFSAVISLKIRTAKPGPGNGCLPTRASGIPKERPIFLTSSLNKNLNGSTNFKASFSGKPPTLW